MVGDLLPAVLAGLLCFANGLLEVAVVGAITEHVREVASRPVFVAVFALAAYLLEGRCMRYVAAPGSLQVSVIHRVCSSQRKSAVVICLPALVRVPVTILLTRARWSA